MLKGPDDMDGVYQAISAISNPAKNQVSVSAQKSLCYLPCGHRALDRAKVFVSGLTPVRAESPCRPASGRDGLYLRYDFCNVFRLCTEELGYSYRDGSAARSHDESEQVSRWPGRSDQTAVRRSAVDKCICRCDPVLASYRISLSVQHMNNMTRMNPARDSRLLI